MTGPDQPRADHLALMVLDTAERFPERPALVLPASGDAPDRVWTYADLVQDARALARALVAAGVERGDRVAIFSGNRPEWTIADVALLLSGAVSVPVYPTSTPEQAALVLADSGCVAALVDGATGVDRLLEVRDRLPLLREIATFDPVAAHPEDGPTVRSLADLVAAAHESPGARERLDAEVDARLDAADGDDVATIIYTSGTTGRPKGVVLTNHAFRHELRGLAALFDVGAQDTSLCFLPLSHALERGWSYFVYSIGAANVFVTNPKEVAAHLRRVRPSMLVSVPKLYEMVFAGAHALAAAGPVRRRIFDWGMEVGTRAGHHRLAGRPLPRALAAQHAVADRLVLRNVRDAIGGPKSVLACGGAPLRREVEDFFWAAGLHVQTGYGLTEAAPLISFNSPTDFEPGTAGKVLLGGELRIGDDGEILYRGENVMRGYWNDPEATAEVLSADGWLRTGDVGEIDDRGFLRITDRLKDIIVTLQGKNIAPGPVESLITADPMVESVVVIGDERPCLVALVEPNEQALSTWAAGHGLAGLDGDALRRDERVVAELERRVAAACAPLPSQEVVRAVRVLPQPLTTEDGTLTPTLKVRRRVVAQRYEGLVEEMYEQVAARRHG